jgi:hypothetical protein
VLIAVLNLLIHLNLKIMKYILSLFLTLSVLCMSLSAVEYGVLTTADSSNEVTINTDDLLIVLSHDLAQLYQVATFTSSAAGASSVMSLFRESHRAPSFSGFTFVGPGTLKLFKGTLHYKLTRASEVEYKEINIVSLPSSTVGAGTHEIVVEASDDLQTWTPVHSSSIGGSKTFFRTRVVEAGE